MTSVLLIDDEEIVRKVVRVVLEAEGYDVLEAADGDAGIAAADEHRPDIVVLDVMMPGLPAGDVCKRVKTSSDARVILLTALSPAEAQEQAKAWGADDFMVKPFSSLELIERIRHFLGEN